MAVKAPKGIDYKRGARNAKHYPLVIISFSYTLHK